MNRGPLAGRALLAAGLAAWLVLSCRLLPYGFHDLRYLFSLRGGIWSPAELVHPAFVPLLAAARAALAALGYSGNLLVPLEAANLAVSTGALGLLFMLGASLGAAPASAAGVLLLAFSGGFWEGALRPDPYASSAAFAVLTLFLLLGNRPRDPRLRWLSAGACAGVSIALHAASLSLIPAAAVAALLEEERAETRARGGFSAFLAAGAAALCLAYLAFAVHYRIGPAGWRNWEWGTLFSGIEQKPMSSIYTSRDPLKQARDLIASLGNAGAGPLLALAAAAAAWGFLSPADSLRRAAPRVRAALVAAACSASYALFFLINNTGNGFVYAALLPLPVLLAALAPRGPRAAAAFVLAALALAAAGARRPPRFGPGGDPMFVEASFLDRALRRGDILLVPGTPFAELSFLREFDVRTVPELPAPEFESRLRSALGQGRRIYLATGEGALDLSSGDLAGAQKFARAFWTPRPGSLDERAALDRSLRRLSELFATDCSIASPQGWRYCRLDLKDSRGRVRTVPDYRVPPEVAKPVLERTARFLDARLADPGDRERLRGLLTRLAEVPSDPFVRRDLARLLTRGGADAAVEEERALRLERGLALANEELARGRLGEAWLGPALERLATREERAAAEVDAGLASARAGRMNLAEAAFRRALGIDDESRDARMSLGAALAAEGRHREAVECYDKLLALRLAPDFRADTLAARANSWAALGRRGAARRDREAALRAASPAWPTRAELRAALARPD